VVRERRHPAFCGHRVGRHDGLYLLREQESEWIVFWQERESRSDPSSFSSSIEAKRAAIEMAIAYLTGSYRF
jgi:hypothetical protein